jgi:RNA polymerase sigma factor (sigma-70 family)
MKTMLDDRQLLQQYANDGSEAAFATVVNRYVNLVYSTALRQTNGDSAMAQDAAQLVFADLARKSRALSEEVVLSGWLHRATCFAARQLLRSERRRHHREQEAAAMNAIESEPAPDWENFRPLIDAALNRLGREDRNAILLRFFEQRSLAEVGATLGINEDTARKRVSRALEKLRNDLSRRGAVTASGAFALALSANAVHAAPSAWASAVAGSSLASAAASPAPALAFWNFMSITKTQWIAAVSTAVAVVVASAALAAANARPPKLAGNLEIVPGVGIGPIKLGMKMSEVKKLLGKPGPDGMYAPLGLVVNGGTPKLDQVASIMAMGRNLNPAEAAQLPAAFKEFPGATKEGIHIGSTGPEVLKAFGQPDGSDSPAIGWEILNYSHLGLHFSVQSNIVLLIHVAAPMDKTLNFALDTKTQPNPSPGVNTADWVITPKAGAGPIKFHMTAPEVEKILGHPEQIKNGNTYEYYQDGIILSFNKREPKWLWGIGVLGAGGSGITMVTAAGVKYMDFQGQTREGIRIGSSRADVIAALGKPTESEKAAQFESLTYRPLALTVRLENGGVTELNLLVH